MRPRPKRSPRTPNRTRRRTGGRLTLRVGKGYPLSLQAASAPAGVAASRATEPAVVSTAVRALATGLAGLHSAAALALRRRYASLEVVSEGPSRLVHEKLPGRLQAPNSVHAEDTEALTQPAPGDQGPRFAPIVHR